MKEIEILYSLNEDIKQAQKKIEDFVFGNGEKFIYKGEKRVIDTYYRSKTFADFNPGVDNRLLSSFRIREKGDTNYITYKYDHFDNNGNWIYSDELETKIEDANVLKTILEKINFEELTKIDNTKYIYDSGNFELVLEEVVHLGNFIEVEYKSSDEIPDNTILSIKKSIRELMDKINIQVHIELNSGKPELMLKKQA